MDSPNNRTHPTNATFWPYLSTVGEASVKLARSVQHPPPTIPSSPRTRAEKAEIGVFGSERHFNMKLDDDGPVTVDFHARDRGLKKDHCVGLQYRIPRSRPGTPSVVSEASWKCQPNLLPGPQRIPSRNMQKKVCGNICFSPFIFSCSDKKAIDIHKNGKNEVLRGKQRTRKVSEVGNSHSISGARNQPGFLVKDELHAPSSWVQNLTSKSKLEEKEMTEEEPPKSLEVFASHDMIYKEEIAMKSDRKLPVQSWDAIPKSQNLSSASGLGGGHEDTESDNSSDLFEINLTSI